MNTDLVLPTINEQQQEEEEEDRPAPSSTEIIVEQELEAEFSLKKKKKRTTTTTTTTSSSSSLKQKKTTTTNGFDQENDPHNQQDALQPYQPAIHEEDKPTYEYSQLLTRMVDLLHEHNPDLVDRKRISLKPPQIIRAGSNKMMWMNFQEFCTLTNRSAESIMSFILTELNTDGSIDGVGRLIIRGRITTKVMEALLRKYLKEYVICEMCRSLLTNLLKDQATRLSFIVCQGCGSSRSVMAIKAGFHAQTRADRRALRLNN